MPNTWVIEEILSSNSANAMEGNTEKKWKRAPIIYTLHLYSGWHSNRPASCFWSAFARINKTEPRRREKFSMAITDRRMTGSPMNSPVKSDIIKEIVSHHRLAFTLGANGIEPHKYEVTQQYRWCFLNPSINSIYKELTVIFGDDCIRALIRWRFRTGNRAACS